MKNFNARLAGPVFAGACLVLGGCVANTGMPPMLTSNQPGILEPVYAAAVAGDVAAVRVASNGCTSKDDLHPYLARTGGVTVLTLRRIGGDDCQTPAQEGLEVRWTFEELGLPTGTLVSVSNPLANRPDDTETGQ